jgi:hypothetical protein
MRRLVPAVLAALAVVSARPARAQFEGRLEYEMKRDAAGKERSAGPGTTVVWLSAAGARTEMSIPPQAGMPQGGRFVTLWRKDEPGRVYFINDERKSFASTNMDDEKSEGAAYQVTRLGPGKVAGYSCERARISRNGSSGSEVCITDSLGKIPVNLVTDRRALSIWNELRKAGLDGVPVSWKTGRDEGGFSMLLTSARKQSVPRRLLEVPTGYTKTGMAGALASPEQQKRMEEGMAKLRDQMKDMTPEQRKQVEKLLEQYAK